MLRKSQNSNNFPQKKLRKKSMKKKTSIIFIKENETKQREFDGLTNKSGCFNLFFFKL